MEVTCACGAEINEAWKYCPFCGIRYVKKAWLCPKCSTLFEHDGKEHPHGILCPVCRERGYMSVGVLHEVMYEPEDEKGNEDDNN